MALVALKSYIHSAHGRMGDIVFIYRDGKQHIRPYVKPSNPDTIEQRKNRSLFGEAVLLWQGLSGAEKLLWKNRVAEMAMSGYNLFISNYMCHRIKAGDEYEFRSSASTAGMKSLQSAGSLHLDDPSLLLRFWSNSALPLSEAAPAPPDERPLLLFSASSPPSGGR